jgi:hypothetical protein
MIKGVIGYDSSKDCYIIYGDFGEKKELHCGDYIELEVGLGNPSWVGTTIEMDGKHQWYCTAKGLCLVNGLPARYED